MERFGGLKKGGRGSARAGSATPGKGKFKLHTAKDPLPLLTKKSSSQETKPKAKFFQLVGAGASTEKPNADTKQGIFASNSFIRPLTTGGSSKKNTGFSFMKFQSKSGGLGKLTSEPSGKAAPKSFASSKPLFPVNGLVKKTNSAEEFGSKSGKEAFKPQGSLPIAFRADTKSSTAKKRKTTASTSALNETKNDFPNKSSRPGGFTFMARNKEKGTRIAPNVEAGGGRPTSFSLVKKTSNVATKASEGAVFKKRGLLLSSADEGLARKRVKPMAQTVQRENDNLANNSSSSRSDNCGVIHGDDALGKSLFVPQDSTSIQASSIDADTMQSSVMPPPSPDCREECRSGIEDELAVKLLCTLDDDKEDEFLTRVAAIQDFTDRVGLEQKQLRNRLLDAHADVSECLLDALTDLMAEEGGIGIDKLTFDMNIDVDVGDAFLQEEIQVLQ